MKVLLTFLFLIMPFSAMAEVIEAPKASITQVTGYDDFIGGGVIISVDKNHASCPLGGYINPSSLGAKTLIAITLSAFTASKPVTMQLYTDRIQSGRCEVDAIAMLPN